MQVLFLVIQHAACEPPGAYEDELIERGACLERVQIDAGEALPDWRAFDAIVAMGGPMGANDEDELPWLAGEKRLIADAVGAGVPYWGVCLGAQLLAASLGARVYRGERPEIGVYDDVELAPGARRDPVFGGAPSPLTTLQWHGDTFDLPRGATLLASSRAYPHQAFAYKRAYGVQFHLEVSSELARSWIELPVYAQELTDAHGGAAVPALVRDAEHLDDTIPLARELFGRWIDGVVRAAP
jgi:GMP synthase-like glutamine amidotransferase